VPSKALIRAARAAAEVRRAAEFGVVVPDGVRVDFGRVMERVRRLRAEISPHDSAERFRELGVDVFIGEGRFTGSETLEVAGRRLRFARAVIATGARASAPPIPGLTQSGYLTNETLFTLTDLPARLAVIGGGPIGCEMAQSFARLGSRVTLVETVCQVLPREDAEAAALVESALRRDGVEVRCGVTVRGLRRGTASKILALDGEGGALDLEVDAVLVAVGRAPNVEGLGLESAGVATGRGGVEVDDFLRTANSRIFAAGDVCSAYKFTHAADAMARIAIRNALFFGRSRASALTIPWCTYTSPELARVGLSKKEAAERSIAVDSIRVSLDQVDRARLDGDEGLLEVHLAKGTHRLLGATLVAQNAGDIIGELSLALHAGIGLRTIAGTIHPYPTQAEVVKRAADAYSRTRLTSAVHGLMKRLLAWRR
jgi:pyruvate/2-oxoglutarate dehydrogenase complex dihydrolipoamide dehydrogenase (E3) component